MALVKHDIPILEYDTDTQAVLMPRKTGIFFPDTAVLLFMGKEVDAYVKEHTCEILGNFETVSQIFYFYKTVYCGKELLICKMPVGGSGAASLMDQLIADGVKKVIAAGCCGALVKDSEGDFFVPTAALRQEGTSYHYLPPSREVELDTAMIGAIEKALERNGVKYRKCKTWTTDGFYRETKAMVQHRREEGYSVVEMECASLAACAKMRNVSFGQLLFTADSLANVDHYDMRNWAGNTFEIAMKLALEAAVEV